MMQCIIYVSFKGPRWQDIVHPSLGSPHVIGMHLFDIFVEMGLDFGLLMLKMAKNSQNGYF